MLTKVFQSGNSQAVRIPACYRLDVGQVEIIRLDNGSLLLKPNPSEQPSFGEAVLQALSGFDDDFIQAVADRDNEPPQERDWTGVFD